MRYLLVCFCLWPLVGLSQELLVNNGFEEENICSEYKVNCAPEGWIYTVPSFIYYFKDSKLAHNGMHFVALIAGHAKKPYYRTFVRSRLLCGLRKGQQYQLQFYIKSVHPILDSIGIYFTSYDFLFERQAYRKITPSFFLTDAEQKPTRDTGWQLIKVNYTATGEEAFITLGNFRKGDVTGPTKIDKENYFFVLFDDVSFKPVNPKEALCTDWRTTWNDIYTEDERHEYLDRRIKWNRAKPLEKIQTTKTQKLRIDTLTVPDVLFATNSFMLNAQATLLLDSFMNSHRDISIDSIVVEGHTDSVGLFTTNQKLSEQRAMSVAKYLQPYTQQITQRGWSYLKPVADNRTPEGRQRNRRVEIYCYIRE